MSARISKGAHRVQRLAHEPISQRRNARVIMFLSQGKALLSNLEGGPMFCAYSVSQIRPPKDRHLFLQGATIAEQLPSAREHVYGLLGAITFSRGHCWP